MITVLFIRTDRLSCLNILIIIVIIIIIIIIIMINFKRYLSDLILGWFTLWKQFNFLEELQTEKERKEVQLQQLERQASIEKQQVYEDAFLEQMNYYIQHGKTEGNVCEESWIEFLFLQTLL